MTSHLSTGVSSLLLLWPQLQLHSLSHLHFLCDFFRCLHSFPDPSLEELSLHEWHERRDLPEEEEEHGAGLAAALLCLLPLHPREALAMSPAWARAAAWREWLAIVRAAVAPSNAMSTGVFVILFSFTFIIFSI